MQQQEFKVVIINDYTIDGYIRLLAGEVFTAIMGDKGGHYAIWCHGQFRPINADWCSVKE